MSSRSKQDVTHHVVERIEYGMLFVPISFEACPILEEKRIQTFNEKRTDSFFDGRVPSIPARFRTCFESKMSWTRTKAIIDTMCT